MSDLLSIGLFFVAMRRLVRAGGRVRAVDAAAHGEQAVTWIYVLGAIVALGLLVYLLCALLKPEWFQ